MAERLYILYDERAYLEGPDNAEVLCCAISIKEARRDRAQMFPTAAIYLYDVKPSESGKADELINERFVE